MTYQITWNIGNNSIFRDIHTVCKSLIKLYHLKHVVISNNMKDTQKNAIEPSITSSCIWHVDRTNFVH